MARRSRLIPAVTLAATLLAACSDLAGRRFTTTIPPIPNVGAVEVTLDDRTGLVLDLAGGRAERLPGPVDLELEWQSNACVNRAELVLQRIDGELVLSVQPFGRAPCGTFNVERSVIIHVAEPLHTESIRVQVASLVEVPR